MKLAVIGGGSTYTPELVAGLARERDRLDLRELVLQDIDPERREVVGGLAGGLLDAGHRAVGLCNVAIGVQRQVARMLEVAPERVRIDQVGLNHLTWVRAVYVDGDDVLPELLAERVDELAYDFPASLLERLGAIPSSTCATSTSTTGCSRSSGSRSRGRPRSRRSRPSCSSSTAT